MFILKDSCLSTISRGASLLRIVIVPTCLRATLMLAVPLRHTQFTPCKPAPWTLQTVNTSERKKLFKPRIRALTRTRTLPT
jgi:hypothetical protein